MFRRHLRSARLAALAALVAWTIGLVAPIVVVHAEADAACGDGAWLNDHHRTAFEDVRAQVHAGHCELCHHQRLVRGALVEVRHAAPPTSLDQAVGGATHLAVRSADSRLLPARAPPLRRA